MPDDFMAEGPWLDFLDAIGETIVDTVADALRAVGATQSRQLAAMAEVLSGRLGDPADMLAAHQRVADLAQDSVKRSYDQLVTAREGWAARQHYRAGAADNHRRRFSNGVMRRALGDPEFIEVTAEEIRFGNVDMLNRKAAQWHRLAFGAGAAGTGSAEKVQVIWQDVVIATLGFDEPASPGFVLPRGVWIGPEGAVGSGSSAAGSDMFYPAGEVPAGVGRHITRRVRQTRGIEAHPFMEAGLRRIGRELPGEYAGLYRKWFAQGESGPLAQVTTVVPARPVQLTSRIRSI